MQALFALCRQKTLGGPPDLHAEAGSDVLDHVAHRAQRTAELVLLAVFLVHFRDGHAHRRADRHADADAFCKVFGVHITDLRVIF